MSNAVEHLKQHVSIEKLMSHYGFEHMRKVGNEIRAKCKLHNGSNPTAFVANVEKGLYYCHTGCHEGGDIYALTMKMEDVDFVTAVQRVAEIFGIDISNMEIELRTNEAMQDTRKWIATMQKILDSNSADCVPEEYDISVLGDLYDINSYRQFDKITLKYFGIKYCANNKRIVVPIYQNNVLVGVTMRRTTPHPAKWLHQPAGIQTGNYLYNVDNIQKMKPIIVTEGIWDAMNYWQHGYENVVATFGCHMTQRQEQMLLQNTFNVLLAYDPDKAGTSGINNAIERLKNKVDVKIANIPKMKDAGELSADEIHESINSAKTIFEWRKM